MCISRPWDEGRCALLGSSFPWEQPTLRWGLPGDSHLFPQTLCGSGLWEMLVPSQFFPVSAPEPAPLAGSSLRCCLREEEGFPRA